LRNKAVFLDRDGTINEEVGHLREVEQFKLYPDAAKAIRMLNEAGYKVVVITNQAGVARGYFTEERVEEVNAHMREELAKEGARIDAVYYCVHHPEFGEGEYCQVCSCRKPEPGMILQAADELDIDLSKSFMIGDTAKDMTAGKKVGLRTVLVLTGYGEKEINEIPAKYYPNFVARDLLVAVHWVLLQRENTP